MKKKEAKESCQYIIMGVQCMLYDTFYRLNCLLVTGDDKRMSSHLFKHKQSIVKFNNTFFTYFGI